MKLSEPLKIEHDDRRQIFEEIERNGGLPKDRIVTGTVEQQRAARHHVAVLKRDGYLRETEEGRLEPALEVDADAEEFSADDATVTIRPARQADLTGIVGAIRQVAAEKTYIVAESVADELDHQDVLLRHNSLESRMFFVATVDEAVIGWVHLNAPELEKLDHTAQLTVGVIEEYRGEGIGEELLDRATDWASENGFERLYQSVPSTNQRAIDFLEDHGWKVEAVREDHYKLGDEYIDEVMMAATP
ncbi:GNAT family N-acetyltransferase [Halostella sp. JP-L12]|uniref:GNAT family N-acetyltransferase n=1 Tax=Halostella TaxID=1843185 RepID=UPI000EF82E8D|nr:MULTISPECIES: GNAT family N-acetyltransferase [Halostella]NHN48366.1 GNAT family N-acetyltransferase [Halostella sp. JP-L12]